MTARTDDLTDKALSIFAFAAYHRLLSGERVTAVIRRDGKGHEADPDGVAELESRELATSNADEITFTPEGEALLETVLANLRRATGR